MKTLLMIGCGRLGSALLEGWFKKPNFSSQFQWIIVQPSQSIQSIYKDYPQVSVVSCIDHLTIDSVDYLIIAIKPDQYLKVLPSYQHLIHEKTYVYSLAAGISIASIESIGTWSSSICIRVMPTIAASVEAGVHLIYIPPKHQDNIDVSQVMDFWNQHGKSFILKDEGLFNLLTPVTGSGLAYFFLMAQCMNQWLKQNGCSESDAYRLTCATLTSAGCMVHTSNNPEHSFQCLIDQVASKGGITQAALNILEPHLTALMPEALNAALKRMENL